MSFHTKIHMSVFKGLLRKEADTFVAGKSAKFKFKFESTYRKTLFLYLCITLLLRTFEIVASINMSVLVIVMVSGYMK